MWEDFIWNLDISREAVSTYLFYVIFAVHYGNVLEFVIAFCTLEISVYSVNLERL